MFTIYDFVGSVGVGIIILTYVLLQAGRLRSESLAYSVLNASGAGLIVVSLMFDFNLSAFVVEVFWIVISLYGIVRYLSRRPVS